MDRRTEHEALVGRLVQEVWNDGRTSSAHELCAPDVSVHVLHEDEPAEGVAALEEAVRRTRAAFPDYRAEVQEVVGETDRALVRWIARGTNSGEFLGFPATGKPVVLNEMALFRVESGRVQQLWYMPDVAGAVNQLGLAPPALVLKTISLVRRVRR
jgi:steroid delta-isomerase-like uncharacterized protein